MKFDNIHEVLIQIFNLNVNFNIIFDGIEEPYKTEILDFVEFLKTKPDKEKFFKYNISEKSKFIILEYIDYLFKKTK